MNKHLLTLIAIGLIGFGCCLILIALKTRTIDIPAELQTTAGSEEIYGETFYDASNVGDESFNEE